MHATAGLEKNVEDEIATTGIVTGSARGDIAHGLAKGRETETGTSVKVVNAWDDVTSRGIETKSEIESLEGEAGEMIEERWTTETPEAVEEEKERETGIEIEGTRGDFEMIVKGEPREVEVRHGMWRHVWMLKDHLYPLGLSNMTG